MTRIKNKKDNSNKTKGFTLIELLVVIAIIALLSSVVMAGLSSARSRARDARRIADVKQIQTALELYKNDHGKYPPLTSWAYSDSSNTGFNQRWASLETELKPYIPKLPKDPLQGPNATLPYNTLPYNDRYSYGFYDNGYGCPYQWYMIVYRLENPKGPDFGVQSCTHLFRYGGTDSNTATKTVGGGRLK